MGMGSSGVQQETFTRVFGVDSDVAAEIAQYDDDSDEMPVMRESGRYICEYLYGLDDRLSKSLADPPENSVAVRRWYGNVMHTIGVLYALDWMMRKDLWVKNGGYDMGVNLEWDGAWDFDSVSDRRWCKLPAALVRAVCVADGMELRAKSGSNEDLREHVLMTACRMLLQPVLTEESGCIQLLTGDWRVMLGEWDSFCYPAAELLIWRQRLEHGLEREGRGLPSIDSAAVLNAMRCAVLAMDGVRWSIYLKACEAETGYVCEGKTYRVNGRLCMEMEKCLYPLQDLEPRFRSAFPGDRRQCYDENTFDPPEDWSGELSGFDEY